MAKYPPVWLKRNGYEYVRLPISKLAVAHIKIDPGIQCGEPCIAGTRIPAETIYKFLATGASIEEASRNYWGITSEDIEAAVEYIEGR